MTTTVEIPAPKEGRPKTRVNWLLRQLADASGDLRVEVRFANVRTTRSELLRDCRDSPEKLLIEDDPKREPRSFMLASTKPMGKKRGRNEGSFVVETRKQATDFYADLVQGLVAPRTQAPKIREQEPPGPVAPPEASRDGVEAAELQEHNEGLRRAAGMGQPGMS